jgi:hypothetical protein
MEISTSSEDKESTTSQSTVSSEGINKSVVKKGISFVFVFRK